MPRTICSGREAKRVNVDLSCFRAAPSASLAQQVLHAHTPIRRHLQVRKYWPQLKTRVFSIAGVANFTHLPGRDSNRRSATGVKIGESPGFMKSAIRVEAFKTTFCRLANVRLEFFLATLTFIFKYLTITSDEICHTACK